MIRKKTRLKSITFIWLNDFEIVTRKDAAHLSFCIHSNANYRCTTVIIPCDIASTPSKLLLKNIYFLLKKISVKIKSVFVRLHCHQDCVRAKSKLKKATKNDIHMNDRMEFAIFVRVSCNLISLHNFWLNIWSTDWYGVNATCYTIELKVYLFSCNLKHNNMRYNVLHRTLMSVDLFNALSALPIISVRGKHNK